MTSPAVIAHRGYAGTYPENTLAAMRAAADHAATAMIELDVQPAACGTPVVFHDDRLEGETPRDGRPVTDGEGLIRESSLETLGEVSVLDTGEGVPTLEAVLETLPASVGVNVELKNPGSPELKPGVALSEDERADRRARWEPFLERVIEVCDRFDNEILFSSFCEGALAATRAVSESYPTAALIYGDLEAGLEVARRYDCEAIHPPRNAIAGTELATEPYAGLGDEEPSIDLLEVARDEGRTVNVWTVETWVQFEQLREAGVDGIVVEYPGLHRGSGSHKSP